MITRDDGRLIGGGGIGSCARGAEIGYWIGVPYWGNGYATEAARALSTTPSAISTSPSRSPVRG